MFASIKAWWARVTGKLEVAQEKLQQEKAAKEAEAGGVTLVPSPSQVTEPASTSESVNVLETVKAHEVVVDQVTAHNVVVDEVPPVAVKPTRKPAVKTPAKKAPAKSAPRKAPAKTTTTVTKTTTKTTPNKSRTKK